MSRKLIRLAHRGVITVSGSDRFTFLQGLMSNDVELLKCRPALWAALLTPQGKFNHEFFVINDGDRFLLDCESGERLMDLGRILRRYTLRSDVTLGIEKDWSVYTLLTMPAAEIPVVSNGVCFEDPRLNAGQSVSETTSLRIVSAMKLDALATHVDATVATISDYDAWRIPLGLPDGSKDLQPNKALLLENGFDELNGVDWSKGCYMGQELTARTRYRGLVKKRLTPISFDPNERIEPGTAITLDGRAVGEVKSVVNGSGLALLRVEAMRSALEGGNALLADRISVLPCPPNWLGLADPEE